MNLEEFLVYIHNGVFASAKFLFTECLSIYDLKNLRLVSRNLDLVASSYPIVERINISSHQADVEAFEGICKNERLAGHIKAIFWDHSIHNLLLLNQDLYRGAPYCPPEAENDESIVEAREKWAELARSQQRILSNGLDLQAFQRALPALKSVERLIFCGSSFAKRYPPRYSPAERQWHSTFSHPVRWNVPMPGDGYEKVHDRWFPKHVVSSHRELLLSALPTPPGDQDIWKDLPFRSFQFLADMIRQGQLLFPRLSVLILHNLLSELFSGTSKELRALKTLVWFVDRLDLGITRGGRQILTSPFRSVFASGNNKITFLVLHFHDSESREKIKSPIRLLTSVPTGHLPELGYLSIEGPLTTTKALLTLSDWCADHDTLYTLRLGSFRLVRDTWEKVMNLWKENGGMKNLGSVSIEGVCDKETAERDGSAVFTFARYSSIDDDSVVDFLNDIGDNPLVCHDECSEIEDAWAEMYEDDEEEDFEWSE
jgi:hypothetical protein